MTVSQLIAVLNWMPMDYKVVYMNEEIETVTINDEWYPGDSCNPNVEPISVVQVE